MSYVRKLFQVICIKVKQKIVTVDFGVQLLHLFTAKQCLLQEYGNYLNCNTIEVTSRDSVLKSQTRDRSSRSLPSRTFAEVRNTHQESQIQVNSQF